MIKFHPADIELVGFVEGSLAPNQALIVSAHCDMCHHCQSRVDAVTDIGASIVFGSNDDNTSDADAELDSMLEAIVSRPSPKVKQKRIRYSSCIELEGRKYVIPETLRRVSNARGSWTRIIGGLWQAPVVIGGKNLANFIYMQKDGMIPEHTHIGNEYTLVLDGSFSDEYNTYHDGDYIALDSDKVHTPTTSRKEGCLVFTVIDQPLHFTSGWAKLINPFSHLYFTVSTK